MALPCNPRQPVNLSNGPASIEIDSDTTLGLATDHPVIAVKLGWCAIHRVDILLIVSHARAFALRSCFADIEMRTRFTGSIELSEQTQSVADGNVFNHTVVAFHQLSFVAARVKPG